MQKGKTEKKKHKKYRCCTFILFLNFHSKLFIFNCRKSGILLFTDKKDAPRFSTSLVRDLSNKTFSFDIKISL